jgi:hypothetical protein
MRKRLAVSAFLDNEPIPTTSSWGLCPQTPGGYRFARLPVALQKSEEAAKMLTASNRIATCVGAQVAPQQSLILRAGKPIISWSSKWGREDDTTKCRQRLNDRLLLTKGIKSN